MSNQNQQMTVAQQQQKKQQQDLRTMLTKALPHVQGIAEKHIDPERLIKIAIGAASRRPRLLQCNPQSILLSLMQCAEVGLEPETSLQHAYLVPYKNNKTGMYEAQFQISYKGLIVLAHRSGDMSNIWADIKYEHEICKIRKGLNKELDHIPNFNVEERGQAEFVYAVVRFKDGFCDFDVMPVAEIERIRARSKAANDGPWVTDWGEMAKKTVIRRLLKRVPMTSESLASALEREEDSDRTTALPTLVEGAVEDGVNTAEALPPKTEPTRADAAASELKAKRKTATATTPAPQATTAPAPQTAPTTQKTATTPPEQQSFPTDYGRPMTDEEKRQAELEERGGGDDDNNE